MTIRTTVVLALALVGAAPAHADEPATPRDAKLADIKKLMVMTGAAQLGQQVMDQLIPSFKASMPGVSDQFWGDFAGEAHPEALVEDVARIYDKHLTAEEVKAIIAFYETPAGQKLVSMLPAVTQESMVVGQEWGRHLGERIARKLEAQQGKKPKK